MNLKEYYRKQAFDPGFTGIFMNPFYFSRKGLMREIASLSDGITGRTLDIGCGAKPYESLFQSGEYVGLELDTPENRATKKADVFYDGGAFPFQDGEFDSVVAFQVLEHVFEPERFLSEVFRVLRDDGCVLLTVPFLWAEHEQPYDYARYSSFGLRSLIGRNGFDIQAHRKTMADIRAVFQLVNAYIYSAVATRNRYVNLILTALLMSPFTMLGIVLHPIIPKSGDMYLDNVILARKKRSG